MTRPSHSDPGGKPAVEKKGGEGRICACLEQARSAAAAAASGLTCHARRRVHVDRVEMLEGEGAGAGGRRRAGSQHVLHVRYVRAADDVLVACGVAWAVAPNGGRVAVLGPTSLDDPGLADRLARAGRGPLVEPQYAPSVTPAWLTAALAAPRRLGGSAVAVLCAAAGGMSAARAAATRRRARAATRD